MRPAAVVGCVALLMAAVATAQVKEGVKPFIKEDSPVLVLNHVRVIDGTGAAPVEDQRIDIENGKITRVQSAKLRNAYPPNAKVLDLTGKTVIPGLVGMHEHLFYPTPGDGPGHQQMYGEMADSAPRLYLAGGVTTARTTGSVEPYTDLALKAAIDAGETPGPKLLITGPYLEGAPSLGPQLHSLTGPEDAGRTVDYWAEEGVTDYKAYMHITVDELKTAIDHAHARGLKITGHLCSVGFTKAAELGIDDLEHGLVVDTEFAPDKKEGVCPGQRGPMTAMAKSLDVDGPQVQAMIRTLVERHVAVTSTLAIFESIVPNRPPLQQEEAPRREMAPEAWSDFATTRAEIAEDGDSSNWPALLKKEMQFERSFVKAGGLLLAGCDPTGYGGILPGYGDQRGMELLVEAGFTPVEAIHIATENGAIYLGEQEHVGSVAEGRAADLVVIDGNPAAKIEDVEKVETVFKGGVGYDPAKLRASVAGMVGIR
ncbi:MAG TPA: amidohydrolase family protein [Acidobacteriaceae bacterium]|jgi:imidazolonepropionase-like amidohydrolase